MTLPKVRALVATVGGSPEPIAYSIAAMRPQRVVLVASRASFEKISEIRAVVPTFRSSLHGTTGEDPIYDIEQADDPVSLSKVELAVRRAIVRLLDAGFSRDEIRVDFTGGTKVMSSAAVLAGTIEGVDLVYIDGARRDKGGLGVVVDGEYVLSCPNPWADGAEHVLRRALDRASGLHFRVAIEEIAALRLRIAPRERLLLDTVSKALHALHAWDRFDHLGAWQTLDGRLAASKPASDPSLPSYLRGLADSLDRPRLSFFARQVEQALPALRQVIEQRARPPATGSDALLVDLIANADRRTAQGELDEAAVRLYRAVELLASRRLEARFGTDSPRLKDLPTQLQAPYRDHVVPGKGVLQLPLAETFRLLRALGDPTGEAFERERVPSRLRHECWLIHGRAQLTAPQIEDFRTSVLAVCGLAAKELEGARWPTWGEGEAAAPR